MPVKIGNQSPLPRTLTETFTQPMPPASNGAVSGARTANVNEDSFEALARPPASGDRHVVARHGFTTSKGSNAAVSVIKDPSLRYTSGSHYIDPIGVKLSYDDPNGFFNGAPEINVFMEVHTFRKLRNGTHVGGRHFDVHAQEITLKRGPDGKYEGVYPMELSGGIGDSAEILDYVRLAYTKDGRWDSNGFANNYHVNLRVAQ
jgi:hypothetical protein